MASHARAGIPAQSWHPREKHGRQLEDALRPPARVDETADRPANFSSAAGRATPSGTGAEKGPRGLLGHGNQRHDLHQIARPVPFRLNSFTRRLLQCGRKPPAGPSRSPVVPPPFRYQFRAYPHQPAAFRTAARRVAPVHAIRVFHLTPGYFVRLALGTRCAHAPVFHAGTAHPVRIRTGHRRALCGPNGLRGYPDGLVDHPSFRCTTHPEYPARR